jgi:hypothetical protein
MDTPEQYGDELEREFKYIASWPAQTEINLGDVGIFHGREFEVNTTLAKLGIDFTPHPEPAIADWGFASDGAVAFEVTGNAGATVPGATAKISGRVRFTRENAVFFQATGVGLHRMEDLDALKRELIQRAHEGNWRKEWRVVTHVAVTQTFVLMLGGSGSTSADVTVRGATVVPASAPALAKGSAKVSLEHDYDLAQSFDMGVATPFFQAYRVVRRFGVGPHKTKRVGADGNLRPPAESDPDEERQESYEWEPHTFAEEDED